MIKKNINKIIENVLLGDVVKYVAVQFLQKKLKFWPKFAVFC